MSEQELQLGDATFSLSDLAGINMDEFNEVRGFGLPRGIYQFLIKEAKLTVIDTVKGKRPAAQFGCEVRNVLSLEAAPEGENAIDPNTLIGKVHEETFFITEPADDIGRIKAFLADIGLTVQNVTFQEIVNASIGHEFTAPIIRPKDKRDPDKEYVNMKRDKVKPVQVAA